MKKEIIIASENKGKIKAVQAILKEYNIIPMSELNIKIEVKEDKDTFLENAIKKAEIIAKASNGKLCIADDSGIEIEYLEGFPGVQTKRWLEGTDKDRNLAIIEKLKFVPREKRKVKFVVAIALSDGNHTISEVAEIEGYIATEPRGENGFGFDEIFELENGKTLSELSQEKIDEISARRKAIEQLREKIDKEF